MPKTAATVRRPELRLAGGAPEYEPDTSVLISVPSKLGTMP